MTNTNPFTHTAGNREPNRHNRRRTRVNRISVSHRWSHWIGVALLLAACGDTDEQSSASQPANTATDAGDSGALTEQEGLEDTRDSAATDLQVTLGVGPLEGNRLRLLGDARNRGKSDASQVRVRFELPAGTTPGDPLPEGCEAVADAVNCLVAIGLLIEGGGSPNPSSEIAKFELPVDVDPAVLSDQEHELRFTAVVTSKNVDLNNDQDPTNNTATVSVSIPGP